MSNDLATTPCPGCGATALHVIDRLIPRPTGTYSLAGYVTKFSCVAWPHLVCKACGISAPAKA